MKTKKTSIVKQDSNKQIVKVRRRRVAKVDPKVGQTAEGKVIPFLDESFINANELKTFDFNSVNQKIEIETSEFSAVCPFSGLPDIAKVKIEYFPVSKKAIELKALKYYFLSFRMVGIYQEGVTKRIFEDLSNVLGHNVIKVITYYNTRGGIDVVCTEDGMTKK